MAIATASEAFRFKSCYIMADHGSTGNCLKLTDVHIEYKELLAVINEAVARFSHLYACGV